MRHPHGWKAGAAALLALFALGGCEQGRHLEQRREAAERQLAALEQLLSQRDAELRALRQKNRRDRDAAAATVATARQLLAELKPLRRVGSAGAHLARKQVSY